jgi:2-oxoglutarate ferredoxin oxidoreductase subunit alpha
MEAVKNCREKGIKAGLFKIKTIWPFPEEKYLELIQGKKCVLVPELNLGQLILEVQRITKGSVRVEGLNKVSGEMLTPDEIAARIEEVSL